MSHRLLTNCSTNQSQISRTMNSLYQQIPWKSNYKRTLIFMTSANYFQGKWIMDIHSPETSIYQIFLSDFLLRNILLMSPKPLSQNYTHSSTNLFLSPSSILPDCQYHNNSPEMKAGLHETQLNNLICLIHAHYDCNMFVFCNIIFICKS